MQRNQYLTAIQQALQVNPVVAMLGPRQCGKTTLARAYGEYPSQSYFALEDVSGLVDIDALKRSPEVFPVLSAHRAGAWTPRGL